ncbi:MAG: hypothetical protein II899_07920 [Bacteroidales bacterium]|nr:hypothetical protein [Bacteroidales bacterium]
MQPRPFSFAPLLGRPPGGSLVGALKRIVFRALIVATSSRKASAGACLFGTRRRKGTAARAPSYLCPRVLSAGSGSLARRGAVVLIAVVVLGRSVYRSAETPA